MQYLYNTMTKKKELFKQISPDGVRIYVCGVTVYDYCHIGHARSAVAFDSMRRTLLWSGIPVIFVKNFTDIDDKIIKKANESGSDWRTVVETFIKAHDDDMERLGIMPPTIAPRATEYMNKIIFFCKSLMETGHAYELNGDVYFRVNSFKDYGKLSGKNLDDLMSGARVEVNSNKENPFDFALWKAAKPGEPYWETPWGNGRPGWHIECSAMSESILGVPIDIHGGGQDLIFPHHENEIAQSESMCGCELSRFWVHNGFVNINEEKMSKSLGNYFTIRDILKDVDPEVLRFFLLLTHYRQPLEFSESKLYESEVALGRIYTFKDELFHAIPSSNKKDFSSEIDELKESFDSKFKSSLMDDINTPAAISAIFDMARSGNKILMQKPNKENLDRLKEVVSAIFADITAVLNIAHKDSSEWYDANLSINKNELQSLIEKRNKARADKDYSLADSIRKELLDLGVEIIDTVDGTRYRTKKIRSSSK